MEKVRENEAVEKVKEMLDGNEKGLEVLNRLIEKNKKYWKVKKMATVMHASAVIIAIGSICFLVNYIDFMGTGLQLIFAIGVGTVLSLLIGIPSAQLENHRLDCNFEDEFDFINDLRPKKENMEYEDIPLLKAGDYYYVERENGLKQVTDRIEETAETELPDPVFLRVFRSEEFTWDSGEFVMKNRFREKLFRNENYRKEE